MWNSYQEMLQNQNINEAQQAAGDAKRDAQNAVHRLGALEMQVKKLLLISEALWQITKASSELSDADLTQMVNDIAEYRAGEGAASATTKCTACDRPVPRTKSKCIYCGQEIERGLFDR